MNLLEHYRKLWFYSLHRFEGDNYYEMSAYFAELLILEIEEFGSIAGKTILDIGGSRGIFCKVIAEKRNCNMSVNLDPRPIRPVWPKTIVAFGENMPFSNGIFDVLICRGVLEHMPEAKRQMVLKEMYRVLKPEGLCYVVIPPWYSFHAGHRLKPFHILPFKLGKYLRKLCFGNEIKEDRLEEMGLYPITYGRMTRMVTKNGFKIIATRDTHFRLHFLTRIAIAREIMVPAMAFILRKGNKRIRKDIIG